MKNLFFVALVLFCANVSFAQSGKKEIQEGKPYKNIIVDIKDVDMVKVKFNYSEETNHPCNKPRINGEVQKLSPYAFYDSIYVADLHLSWTMLACPQATTTISAEPKEFIIPANYTYGRPFVSAQLLVPQHFEVEILPIK